MKRQIPRGDRKAKSEGGKIGGAARMAQLSPEQKRELASLAGKASAKARAKKASDAALAKRKGAK